MDNIILISLLFFLVGFLLALVLPLGKKYIQRLTNRGNLSGTWYQLIPPSGNEPKKMDLIECIHEGDTLTGKIKRLEPQDQRFKSWEFTIKVRQNFAFGFFWADNVRVNPGSYGTLQLNMLNETHLQGFYVKLIAAPMLQEDTRFSEELHRTPLQWKRQIILDQERRADGKE